MLSNKRQREEDDENAEDMDVDEEGEDLIDKHGQDFFKMDQFNKIGDENVYKQENQDNEEDEKIEEEVDKKEIKYYDFFD